MTHDPRHRLTKDEAVAEAAERTATGEPSEVWEHVGGDAPKGRIMPSGRFLVRRADQPAPKWAWAKVT